MTKFGPLDLLGTIGRERSYADLLPNSSLEEITVDFHVRVLDMQTLIATKEEAGRERDLAVLPILRATLDEIRRLRSGPSTTSQCG